MLKIGIIGIGSMGKNHARVCSELKELELVGLADIDKVTVKKVAEMVNTQAFFDYRELLPKIDAAIVSTPTITHYKIASDLLDNGKHVLVEKPICQSIEKAENLINRAERENLTIAVGHIERHNPAVRFVKNSLDKKNFGELITLGSKRVSKLYGRIQDVGVIFDLGIHDIDIMRFLAGEVKSVYANAGRFHKNINHEDHANIVLNFDNGVCGIVETNWLTPIKIRKLFLTCSENFVEADYINQSVSISSSSFGQVDEMDLYRVPIEFNINQVALEKREPLRNEIEDFVNAVENNKKPLASGEDGIKALEIVQAAVTSYKKGEEVKIV